MNVCCEKKIRSNEEKYFVSGTGSVPVRLKMWSTHNPLGLIGKAFLSIQVKYDDDGGGGGYYYYCCCGSGGGGGGGGGDVDDDGNDTMMKLRK